MSTKQDIFDCALALFSKSGYNGVSMRDIAGKVGIKGSSIYNHYAGKEAIMDDICQAFVRTLAVSRPPLEKVAESIDKTNAADVFKSLIVAYGRRINEQWTQMARLVFSEHFYNQKAGDIFVREILENNVSYYVSVLAEMERKGKIKKIDKPFIAALFNNEQVMLSMQYAHCQTDEQKKKVAELMMKSADYFFQRLETKKDAGSRQ
ncbi:MULTISPECIES: TetR/AcrR family transcriptional regulator [unclassified Sporolactobacillus]|uniref:TetR/AcrR family transcriptional regulator n=1 Tax=unclassified Sporolactobacillus TaxID=2628533 RepID=UPI002367EA8E|nr:TetR/AcrR family transcriptional regulator [Sporolactobacillus sp. CQH2019]MDD9149943.1 TetR/AcrR family transcriptional regulator [Sporolactobacillus sp. CQH2019]